MSNRCRTGNDVIQTTLQTATINVTDVAFDFGSGEHMSILTRAERIVASGQMDSDVVHGDERPDDVPHSCADIKRARPELGYEPMVSVADGVASLLGTDRLSSTSTKE